MPHRRSAAVWSKSSSSILDCHAFVQLRSLISLPLFHEVRTLLLVPPTRRAPLSPTSRKEPKSLFASFFVRRMKLGRITLKRPSGLSVSPPNWRLHKPTGPLDGPNSPPPTPGSPVNHSFQSIVPLHFSDFFSDTLLQFWNHRSKPSTPQLPLQLDR